MSTPLVRASVLFFSIADNETVGTTLTNTDVSWLKDLSEADISWLKNLDFYLKSGVSEDTLASLKQLASNGLLIKDISPLKPIAQALEMAEKNEFRDLSQVSTLLKVFNAGVRILSPSPAKPGRFDTPSADYRAPTPSDYLMETPILGERARSSSNSEILPQDPPTRSTSEGC